MRQDQEVGSGEAFQAGRDIVVNRQMSAEQMSEIMVALAGQMAVYFAKAEETAKNRYDEIRSRILEEFLKTENDARTAAFGDPDFQFVLRSAQESFARSGDQDLKDELVRLLVERSKQPSGSRVSLILNDAIRIAGALTFEDVSVLAAVFIIKAIHIQATSILAVAAQYEMMLAPFINTLTIEVHSFEYLESVGCITVERVADHYPLDENMHRRYQGVGLSNLDQQQLWQELIKHSPSLRSMGEIWPQAFYRHTALTALGKTVAHSAMESKNAMSAPLTTWVK